MVEIFIYEINRKKSRKEALEQQKNTLWEQVIFFDAIRGMDADDKYCANQNWQSINLFGWKLKTGGKLATDT